MKWYFYTLLFFLYLFSGFNTYAQYINPLGPPQTSYVYPSTGNSTTPPFDYTAVINMPISKAAKETQSFSFGQIVPVSVSCAACKCFVYLFYINDPELFSISDSTSVNANTGLNTLSMSVNIPQTGSYLLLVTSTKAEDTGTCNVTFGNSSFSSEVGFSYVACVQGTENTYYNSFATSIYGDCQIFVVEGDLPGRIIAYNDNYAGTGDFAWGNAARINKVYSSPTSGVLVTMTPGNLGLLQQMRYADVYVGCKRPDTLTTNVLEQLDIDDAIQTGPRTGVYNCHAWAGGEWNQWIDPQLIFSETHSLSDLSAFDTYFQTRGYTRSGATENKAAIALWGKVDVYGDTLYWHSSVKCEKHEHSHGYAWESKCGYHARIMHTRDNLSETYGTVCHLYRLDDPPHITPPGPGPLLNVLPDSDSMNEIFENISFSKEERDFILDNLEIMPQDVKAELAARIASVDSFFVQSGFSCLDMLNRYEDYQSLVSYCRKHTSAKYAIFELLDKGNILAVKLIADLYVPENEALMNQVRTHIETHKENERHQTIRHPLLSNATLFAKGVLNGGTIEETPLKSATYSDDNGILRVNVRGKELVIDYTMMEDGEVSLNVASPLGEKMIDRLVQSHRKKGHYEEIISVGERGVYVVNCIINGKIFSKKAAIR